MGGLYSGNWYNHPPRKELVEAYPALDVRDLHLERRLEPGGRYLWTWWQGDREVLSVEITALDDAVELAYPPGGQGGRVERYVTPLEWTACNLGGKRPWFVCPGVKDGVACDRRAARLHLRGGLFLCRRCHDLAYASQRDGLRTAPIHKARAIRRRLGGSESILDPFPGRPKGMHRATYARLQDEYQEALERHLRVTDAYLGELDGLIGKVYKKLGLNL